MISLEKITLLEWVIGGGFFLFFCIAVWRLLRSCSEEPVAHEISNFDFQAFKYRR